MGADPTAGKLKGECMRINPENVKPGTEPLQRKSGDSAVKSNNHSASSEAPGQIGGHANVSLSGRAQDLDRLVNKAIAGPETGDDRLEALREQIQNGTYEVQHDKLADRFLARNPVSDSF